MAIQKNFVIRNGLEVNDNLIFADAISNNVGIATSGPNSTLEVNGSLSSKSIIVSGISTFIGISTFTGDSTFNNLKINGRITAGSSLGGTGQYLVSTGTGVTWSSIPTIKSEDTQIASPGATVFNTLYTNGLLDVYVNGVKLSKNEFIANDSVTVTLNDPCFGGETVEFVTYTSSSPIGIGGSSIEGITILDEGSLVGSALKVTSINFVGSSVTAIGSGIAVTVYASNYVSSAGVATYAPNAGVSTYATNAGIATYASNAGIATYARNAGFSTASGISTSVIGGIASVTSVTAGIITANNGFISIANTTPIQISLSGNLLTFTADQIGSVTFTLT